MGRTGNGSIITPIHLHPNYKLWMENSWGKLLKHVLPLALLFVFPFDKYNKINGIYKTQSIIQNLIQDIAQDIIQGKTQDINQGITEAIIYAIGHAIKKGINYGMGYGLIFVLTLAINKGVMA